MSGAELRISGETVQVRSGRKKLSEVGIPDFVQAVGRAVGPGPDLVLPRGVRLVRQRGDVLAVAVEVPPGARRVRWIADDSDEPFGAGAKYRDAWLAFPFVIVLLVLHRGRLTGQQQLYYRTAPLESADDALLLPNLYNVAKGYGQRCWLCLAHLRQRPEWTPGQTIATAVDHTFSAAFNRSSDVHEGNSYWEAMRDVDPRVATVEAWEKATREDRCFALGVAWRPADTTLGQELDSMLAGVGGSLPPEPNAAHLAGLVTVARSRRRRRTGAE
jgi:hypothetical protein